MSVRPRFLRRTCRPNAFQKMRKHDCTSVAVIELIEMQPSSSAPVYKYRLDKLHNPTVTGMEEEFKVIEVQTGRVAYKRLSSTANKGILEKLRCVLVPAEQPELPATTGKSKATKIRNFTPQHKNNIMTEVLHGNHTAEDGTQIQAQNREKHGNKGAFYASICRVLNDGQSYPSFKKAKAVPSSVQKWLATALKECARFLAQKYGADFHLHQNFMADYSNGDMEDSDGNEDDPNDARYMRKNVEQLDFLIHLDKIHEHQQGLDAAPTHSEDQEDDMIHSKVDGLTPSQGVAETCDEEALTKNKRKHKLEKPREKKSNPAVQLQEQQNSISTMLDKLLAFNADPVVTSSSAQADPAIQSISQSLVQLPTPPGPASVCEKLADSLAGYGFCSFQELLDFHPRSDARKILSDLKWSPYQIQKVLGNE